MAFLSAWIICYFLVIFIQGISCSSCRTGYGVFDYKYCEYGCCGSYYNEYCCGNVTGIVVGSVIGGLILIGIIVTVCICYQKQRARPGVIVQPGGYNTGPTVVMATSHQPAGGYGYGQVNQYPTAPYPPGQNQSTSQAFTVNQMVAPPPYAGEQSSAYPGSTGEKAPYPPYR